MLCCRRRRGRLLYSAIATIFAAAPAMAVTHTWNGGNAFGPDSMNNGLNWSGGTPVSGSGNLTLIFPVGASSNSPNQNITTPLVLQSMQFFSFYNLKGNAIQMSNLGAAPTISFTQFTQIDNSINFAAPTTVDGTGSNQLNFNGTLTGGPVTFTASSPSPIAVFSGGGANTISAIVNNDMSLALNKASSVAGSLVLNGGAARVNAANGVTPGTNITVNPTTLTPSLAAMEFYFAANTIGSLTLNNSSAAVIATTLTVGGPITANSNSFLLGASSTSGPLLDFAGGNMPIITSNVSDKLTLSVPMSNGTFNKVGAGTMEIQAGGSTFTGTNTVSAGKLRTFADVTAFGTSLLNNATVELFGGGTLSVNAISGPGQVILDSAFVTYAAPQSYTGGTQVTNSSQLFGSSSTLSGVINGSGPNQAVTFNQSSSGTFSGTLSGALAVVKAGSGVLTLGGANTYTGETDLNDGGLKITSDTALGSGLLVLGTTGPAVSFEAVGTRTIANPTATFFGNLDIVGSGNATFTNGGDKGTNFTLTHNSTGNTVMNGKFGIGASGKVIVNGGHLTLGNPAVVGGFTSAGQVVINSGILTVRSFNFTTLPDVTIAGGTLDAPSGYAIPLGAALQGFGAVTGRVASANGSSVIASGNLTLGDAAHPAGVNLDGELYTNTNTVTLLDSNQAVLGSLTKLGNGVSNGTLNATNGLVLNFGDNLIGRGQINSTNTLAKAVIANGDVNGDSLANPLDFTGYVKGVGTFNNVIFSGTFAPGLSPALLTVGSVGFGPSNILEIEIGGLNRGSQYDALDATGAISLDGMLKVILINSFNPAAGDTFDLFNGPEIGTFSSFNFPPLAVGLVWDTSNLYTTGELKVVPVPEPTALVLAAGALGLLLRRRK